MNKINPLISVIVPIYNIAPYLRKCLDSLKNQTMKQIEVIMIDDGSTDDSGRIAEEYVSDDWPKFRLIRHEKNRGLSAARNTGIDEAKAEFVMFVDSDDWVEKEFCRIPYEAAIENKADLVIFWFDVWNNKRKRKKKGCVVSQGIVDELTAHEYGGTVVWNKLYKKDLYKSIRYPEGHTFEDFAITHKLVHEAEEILFLEDCLYNHISRVGSITKTHSIDNKRDGFVMSRQRKIDLISFGYPEERLKDVLYGSTIGYLSVSPRANDQLYIEAKTIVDSMVGIPKQLCWKQKAGLITWKISAPIFHLLMRIVHRQ